MTDTPHTSPICFRVTEQERALLLKSAGTQTVSDYIRARVFGQKTRERQVRSGRSVERCRPLSQFLGILGKTRFLANLVQISEYLEDDSEAHTLGLLRSVTTACAELRAIRALVVAALKHWSRRSERPKTLATFDQLNRSLKDSALPDEINRIARSLHRNTIDVCDNSRAIILRACAEIRVMHETVKSACGKAGRE